MRIYDRITVDLCRPVPLPIMLSKQGDTARGAIITLRAGAAFLEPTTEVINIYGKKPDGKTLYNACTVENGKVKVDFTSQMLATPGQLQMELELINGEDVLSTPIAILEVLPSNIDNSAVESSNEFTALQAAIAQAQTYQVEYATKPDAILGADQESTDFNVGYLEFEKKPFYPEIYVKQVQNLSAGTVDFEEATAREEISTGEGFSVLFGKIKKWFADLAAGAASTLLGNDLTANSALVSDSSGKVAASDVSAEELGYVKGLTSAVQDQIGTLSSLSTTEKASLVASLNELNSNLQYKYCSLVEKSSSITITNAYLICCGKSFIGQINLILTIPVDGTISLLSIGAEDFVPKKNLYFSCVYGYSTGFKANAGLLEIDTSGNISLIPGISLAYTAGTNYSIQVCAGFSYTI